MEKQNMAENQLAHTITQTEFDSDYDKTAKKLLANKQILAQIMKGCVEEYRECSVDEIAEKYIEGTPEVGTVGVHVDDTNRPPKTPEVIMGSNNEDSTLTEGTVRYDVRFDAIAPATANDTAQQDVIRLIINVEAQTAFNPGYPLTKRAIYYCSRMISAQHGPIFKKSEYGKIRKVYSIWVCTKPSDEFQNTLTRYSIRPEPLIGNAAEKSENYDECGNDLSGKTGCRKLYGYFEISGCAAFFVKSSYGEKENSRRRVWRCNERRTGKRGAYYVQS